MKARYLIPVTAVLLAVAVWLPRNPVVLDALGEDSWVATPGNMLFVGYDIGTVRKALEVISPQTVYRVEPAPKNVCDIPRCGYVHVNVDSNVVRVDTGFGGIKEYRLK